MVRAQVALSSFDRSFVAVDGSGHFEADFFPAQAVTIDGVQQDMFAPRENSVCFSNVIGSVLPSSTDRDDR